MIPLNRLLWMVGVVVCLVSLLCACSQQSSPAEPVLEPTGAEQTATGRAAATPATPPAPQPASGTPAPPLIITSTLPAQITEEVTVPMTPTIPMPSSPGLEKLVMQAQEDLAQRLSIELDQIDLVELKAVVWPDGGLGCPEPGVAYIQVQQEGLLIRLRVGKRVYQYHSGGGRPPFLCEHPSGTNDLPVDDD